MKNSHCCQKKQHPEGDTLMEKTTTQKTQNLKWREAKMNRGVLDGVMGRACLDCSWPA